jgi:hypothetical protein
VDISLHNAKLIIKFRGSLFPLVIIIVGPHPFNFVSHGNNGGRMHDSASFSFADCGFSLISVLGEAGRVLFVK